MARPEGRDFYQIYILLHTSVLSHLLTPPDERGGVYLHLDALKNFLKH
ncbi:hypothetical protein [Cylindrospermopsis raciborskii]